MEIVKTDWHTTLCTFSWWDRFVRFVTRRNNLDDLGHNLEKAFQKSVAKAKRTGKNIEQQSYINAPTSERKLLHQKIPNTV
jgi:hypothetical protein